jgi:molybdopterin-containing oxidoreductase family iron-sulfur binding subunit
MRTLPILGQERPAEPGDRPLWQSLEELYRTAPRPEGEFPPGADEPPSELGRRTFLQLLGAAAALAGLEACHPPREKILPYVRNPREGSPGKSLHYATALALDGYATGLLLTAIDGRPIKVEGNPAHSASLGASGALEQASLLDLYDPARLDGIRRRGAPLAWRTFLAEVAKLSQAHEADGGARLRFLLAPDASPLLADLRRRLQARFPRARFHFWSPLAEENAREGSRIAFGRPLDTRFHLADADVILSLDADFLCAPGESLRLAREFSRRREPGDRMSRLYVAEPALTITGACADHRFRMRAQDVARFALALAAQVGAPGSPAPESPVSREARGVAEDLLRHRGRSAVIAGPRQPPAVHALAHAMNVALGNAGATVTTSAPVLGDAEPGMASLRDLADAIGAGKVDTLVVTAWNPVYTAPAEIDLGPLLAKVPNTLYQTLREDETARRSSWVIAAAHPFESWGDGRARDGTVSIVQPLIAPLRECVTPPDLLAAFLERGDRGTYQHLRDYWKGRAGADFDRSWDRWLQEGVVPGTAEPAQAPRLLADAVAAAARRLPRPTSGIEVAFTLDASMLDGRFAGNAWLQELPDPITKISWDNAALLSPATAARLGVGSGQMVALTYRGKTLTAPAFVAPGHADDSVTLPLGYGRSVEGPIGKGVGFDAYRLRHADAPWFDGGAALEPGAGRREFAISQGDFSMEGRPLAMDFSAEEWRKDQGGRELHELRRPVETLQEPVDYSKETYRWGMAIDLSKCIGCAACSIACQEENNVPVVGQEQVAKGRIMHWLRVDRYFSGSPADPQTISQPVACQHCEAAPCEYVCPVNATVHSDEGLNEMVYNRCVGTRYCSNNCPYKVRRFNFFEYRGSLAPTEKMLMNPDVTVRSRGVMEKCSYCVQRIERARIDARSHGGKIRSIQSACQQACPAEAIVFGNLADPASKVSQLHRDPRRYDLLHSLGTRPRTAYLARIRNPNPDLA